MFLFVLRLLLRPWFHRQRWHYKSTLLRQDLAPLMEMDDPLSPSLLLILSSSSPVSCSLTFNTNPRLSTCPSLFVILSSQVCKHTVPPPTHFVNSPPHHCSVFSPKYSHLRTQTSRLISDRATWQVMEWAAADEGRGVRPPLRGHAAVCLPRSAAVFSLLLPFFYSLMLLQNPAFLLSMIRWLSPSVFFLLSHFDLSSSLPSTSFQLIPIDE